MIAVIRISGMVKNPKVINATLDKLRLRRKYSCVIVKETKEIMGMIKKVRNDVAYGTINEETLKELIEKRGQLLDKTKKIDEGKIAKEILEKEKSEDIKPFFRLHPARGGIKSSKMHFPKGVLGNHKEHINDLIRRMI